MARRTARSLVVMQVGLSVTLLVVGTLLLRSFLALEGTALGFRPDLVRLAMTLSTQDSAGDLDALRGRISAALAAEPGVQAVGLVWPTLPPWNGRQPAFHHAALGAPPETLARRMGGHAVDPQLFDTMGMRMLAGRGIRADDRADTAPVVVISAALAAELGGAERAIGTELVNLMPNGELPERALIVGVVSDVAWDGHREQDTERMIRWHDPTDPAAHRRDAYYALAQVASATLSIAVRVAGDEAAALVQLRRRLGAVAPRSAVQWDSLMADELAREDRVPRFATALTAAFALSALGLAALGLFATIADGVIRRHSEFGLRLALGATPARVLRGVLGEGLGLAALGIVLGAAAAFAAGRVLASQLHGVSATDPIAYAAAAALALAVAAIASWWPARRAAAVEPNVALREG